MTRVLTKEQFHEILHKELKKPVADYRMQRIPGGNSIVKIKVHTGAHTLDWADANIIIKQKVINLNVYINFKKNKLSNSQYNKLVRLAQEGIEKYWSRNIKVGIDSFNVKVKVHNRVNNAISVDLYVVTERGGFNRAGNPAIFGIDASFYYDEFNFGKSYAEPYFMYQSAHEFGHSVLMHFGGVNLSWRHKGTSSLLQIPNDNAEKLSRDSELDMMKYYKMSPKIQDLRALINNSIVMELDVKRLLWGAKLKWVE